MRKRSLILDDSGQKVEAYKVKVHRGRCIQNGDGKRSSRNRLDHARVRLLIRHIGAPNLKRIGGTMSYIPDAESRGALRCCRRFSAALNRVIPNSPATYLTGHLLIRRFHQAENGLATPAHWKNWSETCVKNLSLRIEYVKYLIRFKSDIQIIRIQFFNKYTY